MNLVPQVYEEIFKPLCTWGSLIIKLPTRASHVENSGAGKKKMKALRHVIVVFKTRFVSTPKNSVRVKNKYIVSRIQQSLSIYRYQFRKYALTSIENVFYKKNNLKVQEITKLVLYLYM